MLLRLLPNEHFSLSFHEILNLSKSQLSNLTYVGFDGNNHHFINTSLIDFTAKFVFDDDSELIIPIEVYTNKWQLCSPFELTINRLIDNVTLSAVNWYNDYFLRYSTTGNIITFENNTTEIYRIVVGGTQCCWEHLDKFNNNLLTMYIDDKRSRLSFILKPGEKLITTVNYEIVFRVEKMVI